MAQAFVNALRESHGPENAYSEAHQQACRWEDSGGSRGEEERATLRVNVGEKVANVLRKAALFLEVRDPAPHHPTRARLDRKRKREETRALERSYNRYTELCSPAVLSSFLMLILGEDHKGGTKWAKIRARKILVARLLSAWGFVSQRSLEFRKAMDG